MAKKHTHEHHDRAEPKTEPDKEISFGAVKAHIPKIALILILIFGFYLRFYHVDYPVVGYHNWKETKALTDARNFEKNGFFLDGIFIPRHDFVDDISYPLTGEHAENLPVTPMIVAVFFKIFGDQLWVARMVDIILSILTIFFMYLFVKRLFKREDFALTAAALTAINPMYTFFSHNTDIINSAILFMVASGYFYVKWLQERKDRDLMITAALIMLAFITKQTHIILGIPMALTFPYKDYLKDFRKNLKLTVTCAVITAVLFSYLFYLGYVSITVFKAPPTGLDESVTNFTTIFSPDFWNIIRSFVDDNFTLLGMGFAFLGLITTFVLLITHWKNLGYRFTAGYFIGFLAWFFVLSYKLSGHAYHQYPIGPLVIILMTIFFVVAAANISSLAGSLIGGGMKEYMKYIIIIIFIAALFPPSLAARNRMFDTQFLGLNVAGEYIKANSQPWERIVHSSQQSYGVLWDADRSGFKPPATLEDLKKLESYNATWLFIYSWSMPNYVQKPDLWTYVQQNYALKQIGFLPIGQNQIHPLYRYFLFKKGGTYNDSLLPEMLKTAKEGTYTYEMTSGKVVFHYITFT
jgi:hypothetical protein